MIKCFVGSYKMSEAVAAAASQAKRVTVRMPRLLCHVGTILHRRV